MMKYKTIELTGVLLDAAVALAENLHVDGIRGDAVVVGVTPNRYVYSPSSKCEQGGPIIDREFIDTAAPDEFDDDERWFAGIYRDQYRHHSPRCCEMRGETRLIAAMRAYVASRFGEEVDLP